jgi:hypothetical protein
MVGSSSNFKLKLRDQTKIKNASNEDYLQLKATSKFKQLNISATTSSYFILYFRGPNQNKKCLK